MKRWNKTVKEIDFRDGIVLISTFPILWLHSKEISINQNDIKAKKSTYVWYGKEPKNGITVYFNKEEFYIVENYFNEYEAIISSF